MRCGLYKDGRLVSEVPCALRRDGAIEMVVEEPDGQVKKGDGPLTLVEGPRQYDVRVDDVHGYRGAGGPTAIQVYHLAPMEHEEERDTGGFLANVKSLLGL